MKKSVIGIIACFLAGVILLGYGVWGKATEFKPDMEGMAAFDKIVNRELDERGDLHLTGRFCYTVDGAAYYFEEEITVKEYALKDYEDYPEEWYFDTQTHIFFDRSDPARVVQDRDIPSDSTYALPLAAGSLLLGAAVILLLVLLDRKGCFEGLRRKLGRVRGHTKHIVFGVVLAAVFAVGVVSAGFSAVRYACLTGTSFRGALGTAPGYIETVTPVEGGDNEYDLVLKYIVDSEKYFTEVRVQEFRALIPLTFYHDVQFFANNPQDAWLYTTNGYQEANAALGNLLFGLIAAAASASIAFGWLSATRRLAAITAHIKELLLGAALLCGGLAIIWAFTGNFDLVPLFSEIGAFVLVPLVLIAAGLIRLISGALAAAGEKQAD